jgi:aminoglycoside phosphotransferase family enzyme/predicted kinase
MSHVATDALFPLIAALRDPVCYDHEVSSVELCETHISWVLLTGQYAYKIKKPVDLGFLDFSTLDRRRFYCLEELRLNRRLAPDLYLDVLGIVGTPDCPRFAPLAADGRLTRIGEQPFEYAVRMAQFPAHARLDHVLADGRFTPRLCDRLAAEIARFHAVAEVASPESAWGDPAHVRAPVADIFRQLGGWHDVHQPNVHPVGSSPDAYEAVRGWCDLEAVARESDFLRRKQTGRVREGHGDLHLANLVLLGDQVKLFDCLEFDENLRWIDVINDVAFAVMDLAARGHGPLAHRLLNAYVEAADDRDGLRVAPWYLVYRALVRGLVAGIRSRQPDLDDDGRGAAVEEVQRYVELAADYTRRKPPRLVLTHGVSGSGKSVVAQALVESRGAIRLRSDVERKRLFGLSADQSSDEATAARMYAADATERTYDRLAELSRTVVEAGFTAIVDATFLDYAQRARFRELAERLGAPFVILDVHAGESTLRQRVIDRARAGADPSEATVEVLEQQLALREPLSAVEQASAVRIDTQRPRVEAESDWINRYDQLPARH